MLGKLVSAVLGLLLLAVPQAHAQAQIVNINAAVSGCTSPTHATCSRSSSGSLVRA